MTRVLLIGGGGLIAAALLTVWFLWWRPGPLDKDSYFVVEEGWTVAVVGDRLESVGLIRQNRRNFYRMARLLGSSDPVQAGEFEIPARASPARILDILQHGQPIQRIVTVIPGMPSIIVGERLAANPYLSGPSPPIAEGSVLPDSYGYQREETRAALVRRMQSAMTRTVDQLWPRRDYACPIATKEEAVVLASIVEKETAKPSERPIVAGVYCNRLRIGMKLDADPTFIYPITKGKPLGRRPLKSEVHARNPYNTYVIAGLPPGPITNPGKAAIQAVLHPAKTKALYFVADGTGGHVFAETLAEQNANVAKWYAIRRQRGEM
ncbi:MAG TPA: endolytic transglycosylase MltG [Sphingomicrobium sp.]